MTLHDEQAFIRACRLHSEAFFCHYWLLGPGMASEREYDDEARRTAEGDMRIRGWTLEQIDQYKTVPEPLPALFPKTSTAGKKRLGFGSGSNVHEVIDAVFRRLERKVPEKEPVTAERAGEYNREIIDKMKRGVVARGVSTIVPDSMPEGDL